MKSLHEPEVFKQWREGDLFIIFIIFSHFPLLIYWLGKFPQETIFPRRQNEFRKSLILFRLSTEFFTARLSESSTVIIILFMV